MEVNKFDEGNEAYKAWRSNSGEPPKNPYDESSDDYYEWEVGFVEAYAAYEYFHEFDIGDEND